MGSIEGAIKPLRRETLQTGIYDQLCTLILQGGLAPGQSITVASIAKAFNVSPMPVREAISRLMAAGALTVVSGRSIGVPKFDPDRFEDLRRVRVQIEKTAVEWAAHNAAPAFDHDLKAKLSLMLGAERAGETEGFIQANYEFHFAIYRQAQSPVLLEMIRNMWLRVNPYFHVLHQYGHYRISNEQHQEMFDALKSRDGARAAAALERDIDGAYQTITEAMKGSAG